MAQTVTADPSTIESHKPEELGGAMEFVQGEERVEDQAITTPVTPETTTPEKSTPEAVAPETPAPARSAQQYDASSLTVLEGLDAVRKRPGMYIGSTDSRGLVHLVWEILDNAIDEATAGFCDKIDVEVFADGSVEVRDNGRGIPVDIQSETGLSGLELVLTKLHAGGKFGGGAYGASGGLHGVGASVVNALSSKLVAEVDREGATHRLAFQRGVPGRFAKNGRFRKTNELERQGRLAKTVTGTRIRFWPDEEIFPAGTAIDVSQVRERIRQRCFLVPGLSVTLTHGTGEDRSTETFHSKKGLIDFVDYLTTGEGITDVLSFDGEDTFTETVPVVRDGTLHSEEVQRTCRVRVALRWTADWDSRVVSFVNTVPTPKGGSHVAGFDRALTRVLNEALRESRTLKDKDENVVRDDVQEGLVAVVLVNLEEPQFEGQTKEILGTAAAQSITYSVVADGLRSWFGGAGKKVHIKRALDKVAASAKARQAARLRRDTMRKKNALASGSLPAKLADCRRHGEGAELLIVEGDSAAGPAKKGRDSEFQAILPIRGKIVNAAKATTKQVLENAECTSIFSAVGAGSGREFDLDSIRYGRLIILVDADVDGSHIRCLLLTLLYRYMRPLLEDGRVFAAMPPLHAIKVRGGTEYYTYTEEERREKEAELVKAGKKITGISRFKGLGEMNVDELANTTLDPKSRTLRRITIDDAADAAHMIDILMGNDVAPRKAFIVENSQLLAADALDI